MTLKVYVKNLHLAMNVKSNKTAASQKLFLIDDCGIFSYAFSSQSLKALKRERKSKELFD